MALVNFVRPAIFMGDGVDFEAWDGNKFVGTLKAGSMIQHHATPGEHTFMVDPAGGGAWAVRKMTLEAGKTYYLKPNSTMVLGLQLGLAEPTDERISVWNKVLTPMGVDKGRSKQVPQEAIDKANHYMNNGKSK